MSTRQNNVHIFNLLCVLMFSSANFNFHAGRNHFPFNFILIFVVLGMLSSDFMSEMLLQTSVRMSTVALKLKEVPSLKRVSQTNPVSYCFPILIQ